MHREGLLAGLVAVVVTGCTAAEPIDAMDEDPFLVSVWNATGTCYAAYELTADFRVIEGPDGLPVVEDDEALPLIQQLAGDCVGAWEAVEPSGDAVIDETVEYHQTQGDVLLTSLSDVDFGSGGDTRLSWTLVNTYFKSEDTIARLVDEYAMDRYGEAAFDWE